MGVEMQVAAAGLSLLGGQSARKTYEASAAANKEQADMAGIQADQQIELSNDRLRKQLASLGSSMSAQGVAIGTSQSVQALGLDEKNINKKNIANIKLMGLSNRRKYQLGAAGQTAAGKAATVTSFGNFAKTVYSINNPSYTDTA